MKYKTIVTLSTLALCGSSLAGITGWRCEVIDSIHQSTSWHVGELMERVDYRIYQTFSSPKINSRGVVGAVQNYSYTGTNYLYTSYIRETARINLYDTQKSVMTSETTSGFSLGGTLHKITSDGRALSSFSKYVPDSSMEPIYWSYWQTPTGRVNIPATFIEKATYSGYVAAYDYVNYSPVPKILNSAGQVLWQGSFEDNILDMNGHGEAIVSIFMDGFYTWYPGIGLVPTSSRAFKMDNNGNQLFYHDGQHYSFQNAQGTHQIFLPSNSYPHGLFDNGSVAFGSWSGSVSYWYDGTQVYDVIPMIQGTAGITSFGLSSMNEYGYGVGVGTRGEDSVLLKYSPIYSAVPEPASVIVVAPGTAVLLRRRRKRPE